MEERGRGNEGRRNAGGAVTDGTAERSAGKKGRGGRRGNTARNRNKEMQAAGVRRKAGGRGKSPQSEREAGPCTTQRGKKTSSEASLASETPNPSPGFL